MKRFEHKFMSAYSKTKNRVYECLYCGRRTNERNYMIGTVDECPGLLRKEVERLEEMHIRIYKKSVE